MGPDELLQDAKKLDGLPKNDARRRTIISRAYYAAYHFLIHHECANGYSFNPDSKLGRHRHFIEYIAAHSNRDVQYAAEKLANLYDWRLRADYRIFDPIPEGQESVCVEDAVEIIKDILAEYETVEYHQSGPETES